MDQNGVVVTVTHQQIGQKKRDSAGGFDKFQNPIQVSDIVKVEDGPYKDRQGTVKHLYRYIAFLYSRDVIDNAGNRFHFLN